MRKKKRAGGRGIFPRLAPAYYAARRKLGLPAVSRERQRRERLLHPGDDWRENLAREDEKRLRGVLLCVLAGTLLTGIFAAQQRQSEYNVILRPEVGEEEMETGLQVAYDGGAYEIPLKVESRRYTDAEWITAREEAWETVRRKALGENADWDHVRYDLDLSDTSDTAGISVTWDTGDPDRIGYDGEVTPPEYGREEVLLTALLTCEERSWETHVTATLIPAEAEDPVKKRLSELIAGAARQREEAEIHLPEESDGSPLHYLKEEGGTGILLLPLAMLMGAALWLLPEQRKKEAEKKREKELLLSYPELVLELVVLLNAGMTVRGAWERMVMNYRRSLLTGRAGQAMYEEMSYAWNALGQGSCEEDVYREFGRRCGLQPYLRLGNLLESNVRKGSRGLLPLMREEADHALEERLRTARRLGEEASSKLLLPMMMLFSLVLVVLMAPAMMSFGL